MNRESSKHPPLRSLDSGCRYVKPGCNPDGVEGTDYFRGEQALVAYYRKQSVQFIQTDGNTVRLQPFRELPALSQEWLARSGGYDKELERQYAVNNSVIVTDWGGEEENTIIGLQQNDNDTGVRVVSDLGNVALRSNRNQPNHNIFEEGTVTAACTDQSMSRGHNNTDNCERRELRTVRTGDGTTNSRQDINVEEECADQSNSCGVVAFESQRKHSNTVGSTDGGERRGPLNNAEVAEVGTADVGNTGTCPQLAHVDISERGGPTSDVEGPEVGPARTSDTNIVEIAGCGGTFRPNPCIGGHAEQMGSHNCRGHDAPDRHAARVVMGVAETMMEDVFVVVVVVAEAMTVLVVVKVVEAAEIGASIPMIWMLKNYVIVIQLMILRGVYVNGLVAFTPTKVKWLMTKKLEPVFRQVGTAYIVGRVCKRIIDKKTLLYEVRWLDSLFHKHTHSVNIGILQRGIENYSISLQPSAINSVGAKLDWRENLELEVGKGRRQILLLAHFGSSANQKLRAVKFRQSQTSSNKPKHAVGQKHNTERGLVSGLEIETGLSIPNLRRPVRPDQDEEPRTLTCRRRPTLDTRRASRDARHAARTARHAAPAGRHATQDARLLRPTTDYQHVRMEYKRGAENLPVDTNMSTGSPNAAATHVARKNCPHLADPEWEALQRLSTFVGEAAVATMLRTLSATEQHGVALGFIMKELREVAARATVSTPHRAWSR
ncbi:unnamed protein product [Phytophthora fragariaefolia]|uniref:Unnamed protein product n=1 Tax=Phytophthora fragariaefolia TaxID=1490495 RepID=A0A9W6Y562_9STRA|nr:unnamed protein product [Phytophthora fragariaefolia]